MTEPEYTYQEEDEILEVPDRRSDELDWDQLHRPRSDEEVAAPEIPKRKTLWKRLWQRIDQWFKDPGLRDQHPRLDEEAEESKPPVPSEIGKVTDRGSNTQVINKEHMESQSHVEGDVVDISENVSNVEGMVPATSSRPARPLPTRYLPRDRVPEHSAAMVREPQVDNFSVARRELARIVSQ